MVDSSRKRFLDFLLLGARSYYKDCDIESFLFMSYVEDFCYQHQKTVSIIKSPTVGDQHNI